MIRSHPWAFPASTSEANQGSEQTADGLPRPRPREWPWETYRWSIWPMFTWSLGWIGLSPFANRSPPQRLDRAVGDHLVGIHVARSAGTGLKHVDREQIVKLSTLPASPAGSQQFFDLLACRAASCPLPASLPKSRLAVAAASFTRPQGMDETPADRPAGWGNYRRPVVSAPMWKGGPGTFYRPSNRVPREIRSWLSPKYCRR